MADQLKAEIARARRRAASVGGRHRQAAEKLREARARQNSIVDPAWKARTTACGCARSIRPAAVEDAFSRFDVLERRVDLAEGRAEAAGWASAQDARGRVRRAARRDKVDAELEALKARLDEGGS